MVSRNPVRERPFDKPLAQSTSAQHSSSFSFSSRVRSNILYSFIPIKYLTTFFNLFQCIGLGFDWNLAIMDTSVKLSGLRVVERNNSAPRTSQSGNYSISVASERVRSVTSSCRRYDNGRGHLSYLALDMLVVSIIFWTYAHCNMNTPSFRYSTLTARKWDHRPK